MHNKSLYIGPPGPPGELPLLPPDILFQRDAPSSRYTRNKRDTDVSKYDNCNLLKHLMDGVIVLMIYQTHNDVD